MDNSSISVRTTTHSPSRVHCSAAGPFYEPVQINAFEQSMDSVQTDSQEASDESEVVSQLSDDMPGELGFTNSVQDLLLGDHSRVLVTRSVLEGHIGIAANASSTVISAETVSQLMSRLERVPGVIKTGQWHFDILNGQAGVTALQLQRSAGGAWRVNIWFSEKSLVDVDTHTEELQSALEALGQDIDSVRILQSL